MSRNPVTTSSRRRSQGSGEPRGASRGQAGSGAGGEARAGISAEWHHSLSHISLHLPPGRSLSHSMGPDGSKVPWTL